MSEKSKVHHTLQNESVVGSKKLEGRVIEFVALKKSLLCLW